MLGNKFSISDHLYVSTRVAKHFPGLFESAIVLSYRQALPNATSFYWGKPLHPAQPLTVQDKNKNKGKKMNSVVPMGEAGLDPSLPPPYGSKGVFKEVEVKSVQTMYMYEEESDSCGQSLYRASVYVLLEIASYTTLEQQKFICNSVHIPLMYAVIHLCYAISFNLEIGIYVLVVLAVTVALLFILHLSHERAVHDEQAYDQYGSDDESEEEKEKSDTDSDDDDEWDPITGMRRVVKRSASFDSDDGYDHNQGHTNHPKSKLPPKELLAAKVPLLLGALQGNTGRTESGKEGGNTRDSPNYKTPNGKRQPKSLLEKTMDMHARRERSNDQSARGGEERESPQQGGSLVKRLLAMKREEEEKASEIRNASYDDNSDDGRGDPNAQTNGGKSANIRDVFSSYKSISGRVDADEEYKPNKEIDRSIAARFPKSSGNDKGDKTASFSPGFGSMPTRPQGSRLQDILKGHNQVAPAPTNESKEGGTGGSASGKLKGILRRNRKVVHHDDA